MTRVWMDLPAPPDHKMWCVACVTFGRARINQEYGQQIVALENDGKDEDFWFKPNCPHLETAVVRGICAPLQQLGIMDLCWSHVAGVQIQTVSPLDPQYQKGGAVIPPGLLRG